MLEPDQNLLYQERVPLALWVWGLVGFILLALTGTLVGVLRADASASDRAGLIVGAAIAVGMGVLVWNYRAIQIRVTRRVLEARYGRFNRTIIPLSEITECRTTRTSFGRYLGVGVRLGRDGSMAYTVSFGPAVEVHRRSGRAFVVSSNRPEELRQAVKAALATDRG